MMEVGNRSRRDAPTPCGCSCGWFKTRLTQNQDLIVYQQPLRHVRGKPKTSDVGKNTVISAIVIQNNNRNDISVQTEAFLPEFDVNEINCPRCRHHVQRARALLKNVFVVENKNICVCEMCDLQRLTHVPCLHCENVRKKLKLSDFFVSRKKDLLKQQEQMFLKTVLGRRKMEKPTRHFRAYSDIHLTDTIERINRLGQRVQRPKSAIESRYETIHKPESEQAIGHDRTKEPFNLSRAKINLKNESLLGLGTTGIMRRYHSEESLRAFSSKEDQTFRYCFPGIKDEKSLFPTSAEQVKVIRKRFQTEVEEKIKEQEKIKIKKEIKKWIDRAKQKGISLSDLDITTEKDTKGITKRAKPKRISLSDLDITKEKDTKGIIERAKQRKISLSDIDIIAKKKQIEKDIKSRYKTKDGEKLDKYEKKEGRQTKDGNILKDEKGTPIKTRKDGRQGTLGPHKKGLKEKVEKDEENEPKDKGYDKKIEEKGLIKEEEAQKITHRGKRIEKKVIKDVEKEGKYKVRVEKWKAKYDEVKQKRNQIKSEIKIHSVKEKREKVHEDKDRETALREKKQKVEEEQSRIAKDDLETADRGKENITKIKTAVPSDKVKKKVVKVDTGVKKAAKTDEKATEMHHIDSDFDIPPIDYIKSDANIKDKKTKKGLPLGGVDEVKLLNEVLTKHENYIAVGLKAKKAKEDVLHLQKLKAKQTITEVTEPVEHLEYIDPLANKVEKIVRKSVDRKKPVSDNDNNTIISLDKIKIKAEAYDDTLLQVIFNSSKKTQEDQRPIIPKPIAPLPIPRKREIRTESIATEEPDTDNSLRDPSLIFKPTREIVFGTEVILSNDVPPEPEPKSVPVLFHAEYNAKAVDSDHTVGSPSEERKQSIGAGPFRYALSDRKFIENGWTVLPTEKIVRKVNVYRMHPAYPEFDWFKHNKKKGTMQYSSGEKLAEIDENGCGRWYYKNGRLALNYYDCEEPHAQQRYVVYSSGEPDERGRSTPITVLGMFDFNGNGVVFDHGGKIRLKYNQNEGIVLDRSMGPVSQWKWHSLNDPPELQQVMIDNRLAYKDPKIFSFAADHKPPRQDETLIAIEYENYIKSIKKKKEFKPNQIKMKTMKLNDQFSLKVLDQNRIYLLFRDGATSMKCNLGLKIDHSEIVDTKYCDLGEVCVTAEKLPAETDSLADLQKCLKEAHKWNQVRVAREQKKTGRLPDTLSVDRMTAAASKPPRRPLLTENSGNRTPAPGNMYYNTRLI